MTDELIPVVEIPKDRLKALMDSKTGKPWTIPDGIGPNSIDGPSYREGDTTKSQVFRELKEFRNARFGNHHDPERAFRHAMNLIRMLWPERIAIYRPNKYGEEVVNFFFLEVIWGFCKENEIHLTGPASAGKSCPAAVWSLIAYWSSPKRTAVLLSTTSSQGADLRFWGEIRDLFNKSTWKVGVPIDYKKCITLDEGVLKGGKRDSTTRDMRNAITVIPIPRGMEGQAAARSVIGIKNEVVIWIIDELPEMESGILDVPVSNLESNTNFMLGGLGNAKPGLNPHTEACEPDGGYEGFNLDNTYFGGEWRTAQGGWCIFMDGHKSPNFCVDYHFSRTKQELPFPYLSNHITHEKNAVRYGNGNRENGMKSAEYMRMNRGKWPQAGGDQTCLSSGDVTSVGAHKSDAIWGPLGFSWIMGIDPAFSSGGDGFEIMLSKLGRLYDGSQCLLMEDDTITLYAPGDLGGRSYAEVMASQIVEIMISKGIHPSCVGMDISSDGGVIFAALVKELIKMEVKGAEQVIPISSSGRASENVVSAYDSRKCCEAYDRSVTELWMTVPKIIAQGLLKGFNVRSGYARDLFSRPYTSIGNDRVSLMTKKDLKKLIGRSPDKGDAFVYNTRVAIERGLEIESIVKKDDDDDDDPVELPDDIYAMFKASDDSDDGYDELLCEAEYEEHY